MKRLILLACMFIAVSTMAQRKIALIVAIGNYPSNSGWGNLSSINDIRYIKDGLTKHAFSESDIHTLLNEKATKAGILKALDDLYERAKPNDIVVFHFSGHGQQIYDTNGDEYDGYDEALIPYDAAAQYDPVYYKGENHLRDDDLGKKLERIRQKIGSKGSLLVLVDACHSGTSTRGNFVMRGSPYKFEAPGYVPNIVKSTSKQAEEEFFGKGNMIVISASNPHQVNYETKDHDGKGVGSLSYAFAKAISELQKGDSYDYMFKRIKAMIQSTIPMQIPMIEGDINLQVFGGELADPLTNIEIEQWKNDTSILFKAGFFSNVTRGSRFSVYALNDKNEEMPLATGYVVVAGTFQSYGVISKALPRGEAYKIKIDDTGFGDFTATLNILIDENVKGSSSKLVKQLNDFIKPLEFLKIDGHPDYQIKVNPGRNGSERLIELIDKADSTRWKTSLSMNDTLSSGELKEMLKNIKAAMQVNYLRTMPDGGGLANNVLVEIVPLANPSAANDFSLREGEAFKIRIVNKNTYKLYFNMLNITPSNQIKVLIPHSLDNETVEDFVIQPGGSYEIPELVVDEGTPAGREFMKFIFSKTALDLRPVFARAGTRGPATRGGMENLIFDMLDENPNGTLARSASIPSKVKVDELGIVTRSFNIVRN